jgi:RNA recognition motif-containing protein
MKLYVGNLSYNTDEQQLEQLFAGVGEVASVSLIRDRATGQSRGFGFVEMADATAGRAACATLDQKEFEGRRLTVNEAKPPQRDGGFNRGGGGYNGGGGGGRQRRESRW